MVEHDNRRHVLNRYGRPLHFRFARERVSLREAARHSPGTRSGSAVQARPEFRNPMEGGVSARPRRLPQGTMPGSVVRAGVDSRIHRRMREPRGVPAGTPPARPLRSSAGPPPTRSLWRRKTRTSVCDSNRGLHRHSAIPQASAGARSPSSVRPPRPRAHAGSILPRPTAPPRSGGRPHPSGQPPCPGRDRNAQEPPASTSVV